MIDFENFKVNCSQIADLIGTAKWNTRPSQSDIKKLFNTLGKDYGELTEAQKHVAKEILFKEINYDPRMPSGKILADLAQIYAYEMYGKGKVSKGNDSPTFLEKGNMAEPDSIRFLSKIDGEVYNKNELMFENKWFKGIPDIIIRTERMKVKKIIEVKTSYDLPSYIMAMMKPELPRNLYEIMGYMDILGCKDGEIVHCLVDMPDKIKSYEEKRMKDRLTWLELGEDVISERIGRSLANMEYSGIEDELKIFRRKVTINPLTMRAAKNRASVAKKWLSEMHGIFTKNLVNLSQIEEDQEGSI